MKVNTSPQFIQRQLLELLGTKLAPGSVQIALSDTLLLPNTCSDGITPAYFLHVDSKYGSLILDGGVKVYWDRFTDTYNKMLVAAPYKTTVLKKWEVAAVCVGFAQLDSTWPKPGLLIDISHLEPAIDAVLKIAGGPVANFLERANSTRGLLKLCEDKLEGVGTWRPTLEFELRAKLFGTSRACESLSSWSPEESTGYERYQKQWLHDHYCVN